MATTENGRVLPTDGLGTGVAPALEQTSICLCSPHYPPALSGIGDYTYFLAEALAELGCSVEVVTSTGSSDDHLYPSNDRVQVHRVIESWGVDGIPRIVEVVRQLRARSVFLQYVPHAYDRRGMTFAVNLLPAVIRARAGKRVVVNFHELYVPFGRSPKHVLGALWQRAMVLLIGASSNGLAGNSSIWPMQLRRLGLHRKIQVIPVGSNIPRQPITAVERTAVRSRFLQGRPGVLVGCFGSGADRDAGTLREALRKVENRHFLTVVWVGHSGFRPGWRDDTGIIYTGTLPHPEVSRIMSSCDIFVLPFVDGVSRKRGTLAAALMHGLPIVATRGEHLDEFFVHAQNIYLVPVADSTALARGLVEVAESTELRARLADGATALHRQVFGWDVIGRQVMDGVADE